MGALALSHTAWLAAALAMAGACTGVLAGLFEGGAVSRCSMKSLASTAFSTKSGCSLLCGYLARGDRANLDLRFLGHSKQEVVDLGVLRDWIVPITAGVGIGIVAASFAKPALFKIVFVVVCLFLAVRLLAGKDKWRLGEGPPAAAVMKVYGPLIGSSASLMGASGRAGGQRGSQPLSLSDSRRGSDRIGRGVDRLHSRHARLCGGRLGASGFAALVAGLRVADRICTPDAIEPGDGAIWRQPRASIEQTPDGSSAVDLPNMYQPAFRRLAAILKNRQRFRHTSNFSSIHPEP